MRAVSAGFWGYLVPSLHAYKQAEDSEPSLPRIDEEMIAQIKTLIEVFPSHGYRRMGQHFMAYCVF